MTLAAGSHVGPYEIAAPIGAGGMGEVYRARDTKLGRDVALKVLPEAVARDAERMARFRREAQVLASLNHPNIGAIYGFEDSGAAHALVMELVEGPTLAEKIKAGAIPMEEALPIAKQIAEALEYAHERGIVHRDLKPANVKITAADAVKVLDFGLAKALEGDAASGDISSSPTISRMATQAGIILGTAAYMSPEQAKGKSVDRRADIWSFGCVLYEMLTGKAAFGGETVTDTLAAVIRAEPDWNALPANTASAVRNLLQRCLKKDAKQRLQSIGEARIALEEILSGAPATEASESPNVQRRSYRETVAWSLVGVLAILSIALGVWTALRPPAEEQSPILAYIPAPPDTAFRTSGFSPGPVAVSPDGKQLIFSATDQNGATKLWLRALGSSQAAAVSGTEDAASPFWSPDSRSVGFFANASLKTIDLGNGNVQVLAKAMCADAGGSWSARGTILFGPSCGALGEIPASGGTLHLVTKLEKGELGHLLPAFLPDGRHFLYAAYEENGSQSSWVGSLDSGEQKLVLKDSSVPEFASGYLLAVRGGRVFAQRFDPVRLSLAGEAIPLAESATYSVSGNGVLAYQGGSKEGRLEWFDRSGNPQGTIGQTAVYRSAKISPDGARVLAEVEDQQIGAGSLAEAEDEQIGARNLWSFPASGGVGTRLTYGAGRKGFAVWSPDGKYVAYSCSTDGRPALCRRPADGSGAEEALYTFSAENLINVVDWSPDGRYLSFDEHHVNQNSHWENWIFPLSGDRKPFQAARVADDQYDGNFSPDGRWLSYFSFESGRLEVYVVPFPGPGGKFQVSQNGGWLTRWDTKNHLFFLTMGNRLMEADLAMSDRSVQVNALRPLFEMSVPSFDSPFFDVTPDGTRFLIITAADPAASSSITVLLNWQAALKKK